MKVFFKILIVLVALAIVLIGGLITYIGIFLPNVGEAPDLKVEITPEKVKRGEYLANSVAVCMDCHSTRDWSKFSGPLVDGTLGKGGEVFDENMGFPGKFIAPNITPAKLKDWTDGEIYRAITTGVSKDGRALFPIMPYPNYSKMAKEDIEAIIAYIRTLPPIENDPGTSKADFPMNLILNTIPEPAEHKAMPPKSDIVRYGEYVANAASCYDCHTKQEKGKFVGEPFAGGMNFKFPNGDILTSPNITFHETGIGGWSEEIFISKFKMYTSDGYSPHNIKEGQFQSVMPWTMYASMDDYDLKAIYTYLQTLPKVDNKIITYTSAK